MMRSAHMHQRGLRFTARKLDGTVIYENFDSTPSESGRGPRAGLSRRPAPGITPDGPGEGSPAPPNRARDGTKLD